MCGRRQARQGGVGLPLAAAVVLLMLLLAISGTAADGGGRCSRY
jgi:hypothetical protein